MIRGFDPDEAADSARTPRHLGLAGMKERALLLGGGLEVESAPGKGTAVFARLPLSEEEVPRDSDA